MALSETFFDMSMQGVTAYVNGGGSKLVRGQLTPTMKDLENKLINNLFFPIMQSGFQGTTQLSAAKIKKDLSKDELIK